MRSRAIRWAWASLVIGISTTIFGLLPGILMLVLGFVATTPLQAVLGYFSCCLVQPLLPIVGIVAGVLALRQAHGGETVAVWGIVLCVLTEIWFVVELIYFWMHFPRHLIG